MWTEPVVTVAPAAQPVSLDEAKEHCRVIGTAHDTALNLYIAGAVAFVQNFTGLRIAGQTVTASRECFANEMTLPVAPVQSVSLAYTDTSGNEQALGTGFYEFIGANTLRPTIYKDDDLNWPDTDEVRNAVKLTAVCGYSETPGDLKAAILLLVGHWFDNREAVGETMTEAPLSTMSLIENYRVHS